MDIRADEAYLVNTDRRFRIRGTICASRAHIVTMVGRGCFAMVGKETMSRHPLHPSAGLDGGF